jgi:23S rRNA (guanosine2251-2'-O)-methyltransferase
LDNKELNGLEQTENTRSDVIVGRNPVMEAVRSGRNIDKLMIAHGAGGGTVTAIIAKCRKKGILVKEVSPQKLDFISGGANHQGIAAIIAAHEYSTVEDILKYAQEKGEAPFIIICDDLEDPHNLGAIIRTAEACSVHGIIIPKRHSVSLNFTVAKAASGALEYMRVARVTNIANEIDKLKEAGIWVFGADMDGDDYTLTDFHTPCALVIGNEGKGIGRLVAQKCDGIVSLPMFGKINSLNASVAAGILMYAVVKSRTGK